ncbi:hypothetical protein [Novilysobacter antarcticus]|uniref:hypothetical protein n=1 Tax=Novilysobacter antarcticus TaxID=2862543 RepID=UPI001C9A04F9|nr:hypothetical protein [Lysobacter antarcticus]
MSRCETPTTLWYWSQVGGLLIEESRIATKTSLRGDRARRPTERVRTAAKPDLQGKDLIVIQTKNKRLGMDLMGQTLLSGQLVQQLGPLSVQSIALCSATDETLQPMQEAYEGYKVVVCPAEVCVLRGEAVDFRHPHSPKIDSDYFEEGTK